MERAVKTWQPDAAQFERLVRGHEPQLRARARAFCRDADEARDLVQDTLIRAWQHVGQLRPDSNVRGWLMTIMVNLYRDAHRRRLRAREVALESWHEPADLVPPPPAHAALEPEQVTAALAELAPDQRRLITMKAIDGLRYRDIGARLGIPANTVGTRLRQARKALFARLGLVKGGGDA